jgi:hypothetical protein
MCWIDLHKKFEQKAYHGPQETDVFDDLDILEVAASRKIPFYPRPEWATDGFDDARASTLGAPSFCGSPSLQEYIVQDSQVCFLYELPESFN